MTGWALLAALAIGAGALLWRLGVPRSLASFVGAGLMLGAAGYALQARPDLPGKSAETASKSGDVSPELSTLRLAMFGKYTVAEPYFAAADALTRSGNSRSAVSLLLGGVNSSPRNAALWTALGSAYAEHDANTVSPPARFAFDQALRLAPQHPGPPFFLGVAYLEAGQFRDARRWWARALQLAPAGLSYRAEIADRLVLLDRFLASPEGQDLP